MPIFLFIVILVCLIVVHELGHFAAAKLFGIRVDEFGIGFPPRLFGRRKGETVYTLNALPFGGFVKIFGEDGEVPAHGAADAHRSFVRKNRAIQASVLVAGVAMNMVAAWLILSLGYMVGMPTDTDSNPPRPLIHVEPTVIDTSAGSPAVHMGILPGDIIERIATSRAVIDKAAGADAVRNFIAEHGEEDLTLTLRRGEKELSFTGRPVSGIAGAPEGHKALGIAVVDVGILRLPPHLALIEGAKLTYALTVQTAEGLFTFLKSILIGKANFSEVSGPVGIVGAVGQASQLGLSAVLSLAAVISINLAIINLIPFPALDGGRLLVVGVEAVRRRALPQKITTWLNAGGFALLILLMLAVTYHDIARLFTS